MKNELQKFKADPIAAELIKAGKFEIEKYEQANREVWAAKYPVMDVRDLNHVFELNTPTMATLRKYKGEAVTGSLIANMISEITDNLNVTNTMSAMQIVKATDMILKKYYYLTVADFRLLFNNALMGRYGKVFNRLDIQILCEWIDTYIEERLQAAQEAAQEKNRVEKMEKATEINPEGIRKISDMRQRLTKEGKIIDKERPMTEEEKRQGEESVMRIMARGTIEESLNIKNK